ncbi:MAG: divalent-cation tolerance protein CutA [Blastocatellia bacterium]
MDDVMRGEAIVVLTTVDADEAGRRLARLLVESRLAACVQILPPMTSVYRWQSRLAETAEWLLLIKTFHRLYPEVERAIRDNHSYQTPEILALPVVAGAPDYLAWLAESVGSPDDHSDVDTSSSDSSV